MGWLSFVAYTANHGLNYCHKSDFKADTDVLTVLEVYSSVRTIKKSLKMIVGRCAVCFPFSESN